MSAPSLADFRNDLLSQSLDWVADHYLFEGISYVFRESPNLLESFTGHLFDELGFGPENVRIVGSAKVGFSLSLDNFPRAFSDTSDIDVLIVNEALFDQIWFNILTWHYPRRQLHLGGSDSIWMRTRRKDLYWGWLHPDKIKYEGLSLPEVLKPLRDISTSWFNAFHSFSRYPEFADRQVSGRLYRSWDHARLYQIDSLRQIKQQVSSP